MIKYLLLIIIGSSFFSMTYKEEYNWQFVRESNNISIYYRSSDTLKYEEFKFTTSYNHHPQELVAIISDIERLPQWSYICEATRMIKRNSATDYIYYYNTDTPWPLMDRDVVLHVVITTDSLGIKTIDSKNSPGWMPDQTNRVRIPRLHSKWVIIPNGENKCNIEFYFSSDPGGMIPTWLINSSITYGPIKTLTTLREMLREEED